MRSLPERKGTAPLPNLTRRKFIGATSASVLTLGVLKPGLLSGAEANAKIDIGLIGCGNRGKWIAGLFQQHGGFNVVAAADYFQDRVDSVGDQFQIPASRRFIGLSGYRKLLEQKLDAVVIESPPCFHPEHAGASVEAGKHVYLAKPVAVDVPGCRSIAESGRQATARKRCFLVDFQTRASKLHQETVAEVHKGQLGRIVSVESNYQAGGTWDHMDKVLRADPRNPELRLRAWGILRELSGDIITEQNIHALDMVTWMLDAEPLRAFGTGGRQRDFVGDCWDHFAVILYFPNDVTVSFNSRQFGFAYDDILCRVYGLNGTADMHYSKVMIKSDKFYNAGETGNIYTDGVTANIAMFHDMISRGDHSNLTVAPSVRSSLTTILCRMAAYGNRVVSWQEMMRSKEKFLPNLKGLKT